MCTKICGTCDYPTTGRGSSNIGSNHLSYCILLAKWIVTRDKPRKNLVIVLDLFNKYGTHHVGLKRRCLSIFCENSKILLNLEIFARHVLPKVSPFRKKVIFRNFLRIKNREKVSHDFNIFLNCGNNTSQIKTWTNKAQLFLLLLLYHYHWLLYKAWICTVCTHWRSPGIDSKESIPPAIVLCSLVAGRYDK
jgi:hypothetical protein